METAKIEATISEQGLRTEIMGQGRDVVSCIAAVMNTFAEGIARDEKYECDIEEAMAHVAALTIRRMLELRAGGNSIHIDVETIRKMMEDRKRRKSGKLPQRLSAGLYRFWASSWRRHGLRWPLWHRSLD